MFGGQEGPANAGGGFFGLGGPPGMGFAGGLRGFDETYRAYSMAMYAGRDKQRENFGGKVILPTSAMHKLTDYMAERPIVILQLQAPGTGARTHGGVLEFTAEEGRVYVPHWMLRTLGLQEGELLQVRLATIPKGRFLKIQPQSPAFLEISDPKAVLENAFNKYQFMTQGDVITFEYNGRTYDICVLEVQPPSAQNAIMTVDTDIEVDFAPPVGYVEPSSSGAADGPLGASSRMSISEHTRASDALAASSFSAFEGSGHTLGSRSRPSGVAPGPELAPEPPEHVVPSSGGLRGIREGGPVPAALHLPDGALYFGYPVIPVGPSPSGSSKPDDSGEKPGPSGGMSLREARKQSGTVR